MRKTKLLISLILSLVLAVSTVLSVPMLSANAEAIQSEGTTANGVSYDLTMYTHEDDYVQESLTADVNTYGTNLLTSLVDKASTNLSIEQKDIDNSYQYNNVAKVMDGEWSKHTDFADFIPNKTAPVTITAKFSVTARIKCFVIDLAQAASDAGYSANLGLNARCFEVYAGVGTDKNLIYSYDSNGENGVSTHKIVFDNEIEADTLIIEIYDAGVNNDAATNIRISQIAAFGEYTYISRTSSHTTGGGLAQSLYADCILNDDGTKPYDYSKNALIGSTVTAGFYYIDTTNTPTLLESNNNFNILPDSSPSQIESHWSASNCKTLNYTFSTTDPKANYWQVEVALKETVRNPETIIFTAHYHGNNAKLISQDYEVFASDELETLYSNSVLRVNDSNKRNTDIINLPDSVGKINYVAIRFYHRGNERQVKDDDGNIYTVPDQHLYHLGLYGGEVVNTITTGDYAGVFAGSNAGKGNTDIEYKENSAIYEMNGIEYTAFRVYGEYQCPVDENGVADPSKIMVAGVAKELVSRTLYLGNPADGDVIENPEYTSSTTNLKNVWDCVDNGDGTATVTYSFLLRDIIEDWVNYAYAVNTSVTYVGENGNETVNGVQLGGENMTPQMMYESANAQSSLAWFTEAPTE